jgi:ActR/RegA family two-component response regulator
MNTEINREWIGKPRLLLIDPDETSARMLAEQMAGRGWSVESAHSFAKARGLMTGTPYDLVVIELVLPDAIATDVWQFIRKLYPTVPGFITTSSRSLHSSVNPIAPGIVAYLLKPYELHVLYQFAAQLSREQYLIVENRAMEKRLDALYNFLVSLSVAHTPADALGAAIAHFPAIVHADWIAITLSDDQDTSGSLQKIGGAPMLSENWCLDLIAFLEELHAQVTLTLEPVTFNDVSFLGDKYTITNLDQLDLGALVVHPILAEGRILGTWTALKQKAPHSSFSSLDTRMIALMSQSLGLALLKMPLLAPHHSAV